MFAYVWVLYVCVIGDPTNCGPVEGNDHYKDINECMVEMYKEKEKRKGLNIVGSYCEIREFPLELGA